VTLARNQHPFGPALRTEVDEIVAALRGPLPRRLDIEVVAGRLGIRVIRRDLGAALRGLAASEDTVLLHQRLTPAMAAFTFAHEVGHVLHRRGSFRGLRRVDEEWFADWFARELLLPRDWLQFTRWRAGGLAALGAGVETVALQLAVLGRAPGLMRYRERVLCRTCGSRLHRWTCPCATFRQASHRAVSQLPDARELAQTRRRKVSRPVQLAFEVI
jgi:hypothetical protein